MKRLDRSLADPAADLALDEALLDDAQAGRRGETLRLWAFDRDVVVIGRGSKIAGEVDLEHCDSHQIPVMRRCSGGAAILGGPGCLMYSVVISLDSRPELRRVDEAHRWVMTRLVAAIRPQVADVQWQGTCDLTLDGRKFSGNSLRVARSHILYHGTILHSADLKQIGRCLKTPPRQPDYRADRGHLDFITNVPIRPDELADNIASTFGATGPCTDWPIETTQHLRETRYTSAAWHHRH